MSLSTYQLASDLIDKMRYAYKEDGSRLFLGEIAAPIFEGALSAAFRLHEITKQETYKTQAFSLAEKSNAAVLAHSLQESKAKRFVGIPAEFDVDDGDADA